MADEPLPGTAAPGPAPAAQDASPVAGATTGVTAGSLLRRAREAQGLHIAALAASLKIPPRKLEALERDRYDELPDATFARALALTVCRALKTDPAPVLALLPSVGTGTLDQVSAGLNTPFRDHAAGAGEPALTAVMRHPALVIVALLLVAALAMWFWPRATPAPETAEIPVTPVPLVEPPAAQPSLPADEAASSASVPVPETAASEPAALPASPANPPRTEVAPSEATTVAATPAGAGVAADASLLLLRARDDSWIQIVDATDRVLLSRTVPAGDQVELDGSLPLRLTIGNATTTEVLFRGRPVDLSASTVGNVARIELK
jgi:cytoskeleton protein RodZ